MNNRFAAILIFSLFLVSCSTTRILPASPGDFETLQIQHEFTLDNDVKVFDIGMYESNLIIAHAVNHFNKLYHIYDMNTLKKQKEFLPIGNDRYDVQTNYDMNINEQTGVITIFDDRSSRIIRFQVDSLLSSEDFIPEVKSIENPCLAHKCTFPLESGHIIVNDLFNYWADTENVPEIIYENSSTGVQNKVVYRNVRPTAGLKSGKASVSPDQSKMVIVYSPTPEIEFWRIKKHRLVQSIERNFIDNKLRADEPERVFRCPDVCSTDKLIACVVNEHVLGGERKADSEILIYNWKGKVLRRLRAEDTSIEQLTFTPDGSSLIVLYDANGKPAIGRVSL